MWLLIISISRLVKAMLVGQSFGDRRLHGLPLYVSYRTDSRSFSVVSRPWLFL